MKNRIYKIEIKKGPTAMESALNYDYHTEPNCAMRFVSKNQVHVIHNDTWARFIHVNKSCHRIADLIEDIFYNSILVIRIPPRSHSPMRRSPGLIPAFSFVCGIVGINTGETSVPD